MADPVLIATVEEVWKKVATGVLVGQIWKQIIDSDYLITYRATGNPAPTDLSDAQPWAGQSALIESPTPIDVYVYSRKAGSVRVDL